MHSSHIKPQTLAAPLTLQQRGTKPRSVEAQLVTPVTEWELEATQRAKPVATRDARLLRGDEDDQTDFDQAQRQAGENAEGQAQGGEASPEDDHELSQLLGAGSAERSQAKQRETESDVDTSLQELLNHFVNPNAPDGGTR